MKSALKVKLIIFLIMIAFMFGYMFVFGSKNGVIGIMVVMAALMNMDNDLSYRPKLSFLKIMILLLILGIVAFLNNPITIGGCILTFLVVFGVTFTSYHLFAMSVYLPYLMCYFMMMCIPVSLEDLPMRLLGLIFGAIFIVGLNLLVNRNKSYKLSKTTISNLINEINRAIDVKLDGGYVTKDNFKIASEFYKNIYSKFEYKYYSNSTQESILNVVKSFQNIGWILSEYDFTLQELKYLKSILEDIENVKSVEIFDGIDIETKELNLILLNLEIIVNEIENKDLTNEYNLPDKNSIKKLIKPVIKKQFSFHSVKFTFAFKMAFILVLWEVLTLIFNLPFTKWLYFASIPLMLPYVNDMAYTAKTRVAGTIIGVFIFGVIMIIVPYIPLDSTILVMLILIVCIFGMAYKMEDKLQMTIFTTIMSVVTALMYISVPEAMFLKILWIIVAVVVVSIFNFGFLPYSVEKETKNNLITSFKLNEESINLIKLNASGNKTNEKTTILVVSNIIRENIEVNDDNRSLFELQTRITDICNFIINYMNIHEFSNSTNQKIIEVIENSVMYENLEEFSEKVIVYSTQYVVNLLNEERKLIKDYYGG